MNNENASVNMLFVMVLLQLVTIPFLVKIEGRPMWRTLGLAVRGGSLTFR